MKKQMSDVSKKRIQAGNRKQAISYQLSLFYQHLTPDIQYLLFHPCFSSAPLRETITLYVERYDRTG